MKKVIGTPAAKSVFAIGITMACLVGMTACHPPIQPDPNPPRVYLLYFQPGSNGAEGSQVSVSNGGQLSVPGNWLGQNQANIRVYGDSAHGVKQLTISGTAVGTCYSQSSSGDNHSIPTLSTGFPSQTQSAPPGTTESPMAFNLGNPDAVAKGYYNIALTGQSCGNLTASNLPFFLGTPATWTITASTVNGSNLTTTGTFTINLK
jgi:hypothetical protein